MNISRSGMIAFATSTVFICTSAAAADYPFVIEQLPQHLEGRILEQSAALQVTSVGSVDEYFVSKLKLWDTSTPIRVCFFGGSSQLRSRIAKIASQWGEAGGYVPFDFGSIDAPQSCGNGRFQIRVGYEYKGYWSTVGRDSEDLAAQSEQSMNFALFNINPPPEPEFSRVVLHEFGHAIGLQHEHQSYKAPCVNEFDWDAIYNYLQGPPNYWSTEQIDHNLKPRPSGDNNEASTFDVTSIMLYSFPKNFYKSGVSAQCYTSGNSKLSDFDKDFVKKYYPANVEQAQGVRKQALLEFNNRIDTLDIDDVSKSIAKLSAARIASQRNDVRLNLYTIWQRPDGFFGMESQAMNPTLDYLDRSQILSREEL
ncbi:hypothetical protein [Sinorhizobium medicae]